MHDKPLHLAEFVLHILFGVTIDSFPAALAIAVEAEGDFSVPAPTLLADTPLPPALAPCAFASPVGWHIDTLCSWQSGPFARWAMPIRDDYVFPPAILAFVADPPAGYFFGHSCERCGLMVTICTSCDGKTGPRPLPFSHLPGLRRDDPFRGELADGAESRFTVNGRVNPTAGNA